VRSAEHDAGPVRHKCLRRSEPQTPAAAGHKVNPVSQSKIHPAIVPMRWRQRNQDPQLPGPVS
jgi:hypothetical protein